MLDSGPLPKEGLSSSSPSQICESDNSLQSAAVELFVGDLSFFCDEHHLLTLFAPFGRIFHVVICRSESRGHSLLYGFVKLFDRDSANTAAAALNNVMFMGRYLRVQVGAAAVGSTVFKQQRCGIPVHVSFNAAAEHPETVNEEVLRSTFQAFGVILDVIIKRHMFSKNKASQTGYGFVYMENMSSAMEAISSLHGRRVDGIDIQCDLSRRQEELDAQSANPANKAVPLLTARTRLNNVNRNGTNCSDSSKSTSDDRVAIDSLSSRSGSSSARSKHSSGCLPSLRKNSSPTTGSNVRKQSFTQNCIQPASYPVHDSVLPLPQHSGTLGSHGMHSGQLLPQPRSQPLAYTTGFQAPSPHVLPNRSAFFPFMQSNIQTSHFVPTNMIPPPIHSLPAVGLPTPSPMCNGVYDHWPGPPSMISNMQHTFVGHPPDNNIPMSPQVTMVDNYRPFLMVAPPPPPPPAYYLAQPFPHSGFDQTVGGFYHNANDNQHYHSNPRDFGH